MFITLHWKTSFQLPMVGLYVFASGSTLFIARRLTKKKESVQDREPRAKLFHKELRQFLSTAGGRQKDSKWGRFPRDN